LSGNIDERIVEMTFKGESFEAGVKNTLQALLGLKNGLNNLKGSEKDINNLDEAGKRFSLKGMSDGISSIAGHFKTLSIVGVTAIATIANRAVNAGITMVKALTIDPIKAGLDVYETKINAIQTILANTSQAGTTLKQVTDALNQLNVYANLTVYNFGQMAKNIGTFTAAGVGLKTAVASIKGIANLAALSGSSADQASGAMYQLSQAIASGTLKLQDWNSVVNAGLGGKVFQKALIDTARVHGVAIDAMIKKDKGFRNTLQQGWLTSRILTETLKNFTGDLSLSQIKALGYTNKEAQAILKQGKLAVDSATKIRTITQLMQALKEEVATAWATVFEAIIGNSKQAKATLSSLHTVAENALTKPIYALAHILQQFTDLGGRAILIKSITNVFHSLGMVLSTVGAAFREVFPTSGAGASSGLLNMAKAVERLTASLTPSKKTLSELRTIFVGLFSAVKIVIDVISALIGGVFQIGGATKQAGGGFLAFVAVIAHFITNLRKAIESGTALQTFFKTLGSIIAFPVKALGAIIGALGGLGGAAGKATSGISSFIQKIGGAFSKIGEAIVNGIRSGDLASVGSIINQLLLGGVLLSIRKFISGLGHGTHGGGLFHTIKESFESLTVTLKTMQASLKAGILQKIAIAIGILAASLLILSLINVGNLVKALTAITVLFTELGAAMSAVTKIGAGAGIVKMAAIGVALNLLATAILILSGAVAILAQFSWEQLAKGLGAIAVLLLELVVATALMSADSKGLISSAIAMEIMAVALNTLALAVLLLGKQKLGNLVKGIGAIAVLLALLAGFNAISGAQLIGTAVAMVVLGAALNVIAIAIGKLGSMSVGTLAKGLISIAAALLIITVAMSVMPPSMIATSVSLLLVATALVILSQALQSMGGMSWTEIAKSLIVLAGSLVIISAALLLMTGSLSGAAALIVVAGALAILTPILVVLGNLSWESIAKGMVALAGVFLIIAAAGILLTPLVPTLLGLGLAITLLGIGILAAGAGVALFAVGLTALAAAVGVSGAVILAFVSGILSLIPLALRKIGEGIVAFAGAIGNGAVAITSAFVAILTAIFNAIIKVVPLAGKAFGAILVAILGIINRYSPQIITTFFNLILRILNGLAKYYPRFVSAGIDLLVNLLNGIARQIPRVANAGVNVIVAFINAIGNSIQRIVRAGINMVINLVNGIADQIRSSSGRMNAAGRNLASAIIQGMINGITGGIAGVISAVVGAAKSALGAAMNAIKGNSPSKEFMKVGDSMMQGWGLGVVNNSSFVIDSMSTVADAALVTLKKTISDIGGIIDSNMDLQPRITPVLDLTQAKKGFSDLAGLSKSQLIVATASASSAASISSANRVAAEAAGLISAGGTNLTFNQYNTSPENLSAADIYRKTKNQLSIAKGALANANSG
jgi:tape measure domain-containing protein